MAKSLKKKYSEARKVAKKVVASHEHVWDVFVEEEEYWECLCMDACHCRPDTYAVARCTVKGCKEKLDSYQIADRLNSLHEMSE